MACGTPEYYINHNVAYKVRRTLRNGAVIESERSRSLPAHTPNPNSGPGLCSSCCSCRDDKRCEGCLRTRPRHEGHKKNRQHMQPTSKEMPCRPSKQAARKNVL